MNETVYQSIRDATDPILERSYPIFHETAHDPTTEGTPPWN
jgi:hypothetical protein